MRRDVARLVLRRDQQLRIEGIDKERILAAWTDLAHRITQR